MMRVCKKHNIATSKGSCHICNRPRSLAWAAAHRERKIWQDIIRRCDNPNRREYPAYGGRGIKICERWYIYENFIADVGPRPSPIHTIDRINNDGNYEPSNVRWATPEEQNGNRRGCYKIEFNGKINTIAGWSRECGINENTLRTRLITYKWPIEIALTKETHARSK